MMTYRQKIKGFTLLEILLVLAIASSLVVLMLNYTTQKSDELRRDKTVLQMQQILNAGLSFYLANAYWPLVGASINSPQCENGIWTATDVLKPNYIPSTLVNNAYANPYLLSCNKSANGGGFLVYTTVNNPINAAIIAGRLPLAYTTTPASITNGVPPTQPSACKTAPYTDCTVVVANVSVPGQNLNNARSINFAGIYNNGACVPAPNCPPNMRPNIFVAPVSVAGITSNPTCSDPNDPSTCSNIQAYPLTSFVAFARGSTSPSASSSATSIDPVPSTGSGASINASPYDCAVSTTSQPVACNAGLPNSSLPASEPAGTKYWRVCLAVFTENGQAYPAADSNKYNTGKLIGSIMAVTRCVPNTGNETPKGSPITVWTPNISGG